LARTTSSPLPTTPSLLRTIRSVQLPAAAAVPELTTLQATVIRSPALASVGALRSLATRLA
jgi:hypothetical protein